MQLIMDYEWQSAICVRFFAFRAFMSALRVNRLLERTPPASTPISCPSLIHFPCSTYGKLCTTIVVAMSLLERTTLARIVVP